MHADGKLNRMRMQQSGRYIVTSLHENMEILLESHLMDYNSLESKLLHIKEVLHNAEESVALRLDTSRNQLLVADTILSIITLAITSGSFIGALYGMNLINHMESYPHAFSHVVIITVIGMTILVTTIIIFFRAKGILPNKMRLLSFKSNNYKY